MAIETAILAITAAAAVGGVAVSALKKPPKVNQPVRQVERTPSAVSDALQLRRGARVNQRTGGLGAEAGPGSGAKTQLGT